MSDEDEQKRDEILKRMLETPPQPHKPSKVLKKKTKTKKKTQRRSFRPI